MVKAKAKISLAEKASILILIALALILFNMYPVVAAPGGVTIVSNVTEQPNATAAASLTTAGGTFTTLVLNGTFQNPRWKAYVGNISGILTLDDNAGYTIYEWNLSTISGEIYVTRNSTIDWTSVNCTNQTKIAAEQTFLHMNDSSVDSINKTFNYTSHKSFYVSTRSITASSCRSLATYINDVKQTINEASLFQEVLLADTYTNIIYTTILEDNTLGFDNGRYDFQMIVPEDDTKTTPTTYYFYAELS